MAAGTGALLEKRVGYLGFLRHGRFYRQRGSPRRCPGRPGGHPARVGPGRAGRAPGGLGAPPGSVLRLEDSSDVDIFWEFSEQLHFWSFFCIAKTKQTETG